MVPVNPVWEGKPAVVDIPVRWMMAGVLLLPPVVVMLAVVRPVAQSVVCHQADRMVVPVHPVRVSVVTAGVPPMPVESIPVVAWFVTLASMSGVVHIVRYPLFLRLPRFRFVTPPPESVMICAMVIPAGITWPDCQPKMLVR